MNGEQFSTKQDGSDNLMVKHPPQPEPIRVEIEATNACNASCSFCPKRKMRRKIGYINLDHLHNFLYKLNNYQRNMWINKCSDKSRFPCVVFGGLGEPLLHPRIVDMVNRANKYGFETELVTNGQQLSSNIASELDKAGLNTLAISLHSVDPEVYYNLTGRSLEEVLPRVRETLEILQNLNITVEIWSVYPPTYSTHDQPILEEKKRIHKFLRPYKGVKLFGPTPAWNRGGLLLNTTWPCVRDYDNIWCELLYYTFNITWDGVSVMCCCDYFQLTSPLGNAWNEPIELIQKRRAQIFHSANKPPICRLCRRPQSKIYLKKVYPNLKIEKCVDALPNNNKVNKPISKLKACFQGMEVSK